MSFRDFASLTRNIQKQSVKTIVIAAAEDAYALAALKDLQAQVSIRCFLVGNRQKIIQICEQLDFEIDEANIIHATNEVESATKAVSLVKEGKADILMKGKIHTSTLLKAVLNKESGIQSGSGLISHLTVLECPTYHKLMFLSDAAINPKPDLNQKRAILQNAVAFMHKLGYQEPNVAALTAVETVSEKMPETIDAAKLAKQNQTGEITGCHVEGPISFDLAISHEAAEAKGFSSKLVGETDLFLMPNISTGNIMTKALLYLGGAKMAGCVLGVTAPIVLTSRGATAEEKLLSILLAMAAQ